MSAPALAAGQPGRMWRWTALATLGSTGPGCVVCAKPQALPTTTRGIRPSKTSIIQTQPLLATPQAALHAHLTCGR